MPDIGTNTMREVPKVPKNRWIHRRQPGSSGFFSASIKRFFGKCWAVKTTPPRRHSPVSVGFILSRSWCIFTKKCQSNWIQVREFSTRKCQPCLKGTVHFFNQPTKQTKWKKSNYKMLNLTFTIPSFCLEK